MKLRELNDPERGLILLVWIFVVLQVSALLLAVAWGVFEELVSNIIWFADFAALMLMLWYVAEDDPDARMVALFGVATIQAIIFMGIASYLVPAPGLP